nr:S-layer homology domain-containing protein [Lysinibacillus timonensis]
MLKNIIIIFSFLFAFSIFGTVEVSAQSKTSPYQDVHENHWAYDEIAIVTANNLLLNAPQPYFKPNNPISKAEAAVAIARALKIDHKCEYEARFIDVQSSDSYYNAICQLTSLGVLEDSLMFHPHYMITRAEFMEMLALAFHIEVDSVNTKSFKDVQNHPLKDYIESLTDLKIVSGVRQEYFAPERNVTRAQLAIFICRALEFQKRIENHEIIYDFLSKDYIETKNDFSYWSSEVVRLVNEERKKANLPLLMEDPQLTQIAIVKANDFIDRHYFEHESPYYGHPWDLAGLFDYDFISLGENIAKNYYSPKEVVKAWLNSPGHRENILRPEFTNIGVGVKKELNGNYYWVQMFSSK